MITLLGSVFVASLVGSLHCAGMCGGLVALATARAPGPQSSVWQRARQHGAYQLCRLFAYVTLGIAAGSAGSAVNLLGRRTGLGQTALTLSGTLMVLWAAIALFRQFSPNHTLLKLSSKASSQWSSRLLTQAYGLSPNLRAAIMGAVTGLLPCGWLYAFVITAAGSGSAPGGALVMTAFWLGNVPVLTGWGSLAGTLSRKLGRRLPVLSAALLLLLGLGTLWQRSQLAFAGAPGNTELSAPAKCH